MIGSRLRRFFIESLAGPGERCELDPDESHHLIHVMRAKPGERVALFDGRGHEADAQVVEVGRRHATLEVIATRESDVEPRLKLTIACAPPRSNRMDFLVEKCAELGVTRLVPLLTERGVVDPERRMTNQLRRWRRAAIEAAKQCGSARLMQIHEPTTLNALFDEVLPDSDRLVASPSCNTLQWRELQLACAGEATVLIGPEGGFTDDELRAAVKHRFKPFSLGPHVLRVETAAIAAAAVMLIGSSATESDVERNA